jgi:hypothetical protein
MEQEKVHARLLLLAGFVLFWTTAFLALPVNSATQSTFILNAA